MKKLIVVIMFVVMKANAAFYSGLLEKDGSAVLAETLFTLSFYVNKTADGSRCTIFEESVSVDTTNTYGEFNIEIGTGSVLFGEEKTLSSSGTFPCKEGSFESIVLRTERKMRVTISVSGGSNIVMGDIKLGKAFIAQDSLAVGGIPAEDVASKTEMNTFLKTETDPLVKNFAKADLPVCPNGHLLKPSLDGDSLLCVDVAAEATSSFTSTLNSKMNAVSGISGSFLKSTGTTTWTSSFISMGDIKGITGMQLFPSSCSSNQTTTWSSLTDSFLCSNIMISADQISNIAAVGKTGSYNDLLDKPSFVESSDGRLSDNRIPSDNSVTAIKLTNAAVTNSKIADGAVTSSKIISGTILGSNIAANTITDSNINNISTPGKVSGTAITGGNIVTSGKLEITDNTDSSSLTTGSVITSGGMSVKKSLTVGNNIALIGQAAQSSVKITNDAGASLVFDGNNGNVQIAKNWSMSGGTYEIATTNLVNGGSYTLIIAKSTSVTYTFGGQCASPRVYFLPANKATTAGSHTIYDIMYYHDGTNGHCYVSWSSGFGSGL